MPVLKLIPRKPLAADKFYITKITLPMAEEKLKVIRVGTMVVIAWSDFMITHDGEGLVEDVVSLVQYMRSGRPSSLDDLRNAMREWFLATWICASDQTKRKARVSEKTRGGQ